MSFVDMQPSASSRSKVVRTAPRSAASGSATTASVVSTHSMVARLGASIPAPLAMPPSVQPPGSLDTASLATVSVVRMASAAAAPPSTVRVAAAAETPGSKRVIGSRSPINPVEHTTTSPAPMPRWAATVFSRGVGVREPVRSGAGIGAAGVEHDGPRAAVGQDLLRPQNRRRLHPVCGEHSGGSVERAVVDDQGEVPAAGRLQTGGHSGGPEALRCGHAHGATPSAVRPAVSSRPRSRLAFCTACPAGTLTQVVDGARDDDPPGAPVHSGLEMGRVAAQGGRRVRLLPLRQDMDERLVGIGRGQRAVGVGGGHRLGRTSRHRGQDAARHRRQDGGHRQAARTAGPADLSDMLMPADLVRRHVAHDLCAEQVGFRLAAGPGRTAGGHDHHVLGIGHTGDDERCQRQDHGDGVTAGVGDATAGSDNGAGTGQLGQPVRPRWVQPVVGAEVHDRDVLWQVRHQRTRHPVRQSQEHQVRLRQHRGRGVGERQFSVGAQVGMHRPDGLAGVAVRRRGAELQVGMRRDQAQQLTTCVAAGARDRDPVAHTHKYAWPCKFMRSAAPVKMRPCRKRTSHWSSTCVRPCVPRRRRSAQREPSAT